MIYKTIIQQFDEQGEKTGWTYIGIPVDIAEGINKGVKKTYRVKGKIDNHIIKSMAILPMGDGSYIMPINAAIRKAISKRKGEKVCIDIVVDNDPLPISSDLLECLQEEDTARKYFNSLTPGHQRYFSNWIESAKTIETKTKRITISISGLSRKMDYGAIIREQKANKD